jgi:DNA topoisomerase-3
VGINGTRLFSSVHRTFLSVGRVQTPTLAMLAERDCKVKNFTKEQYFTAELTCGNFAASSERIDGKEEAGRIASACDGKRVTVSGLKRESKAASPPKLYDLTSLQREANKAFGHTAAQTLGAAQKLYEAKLLTYPRTDSRYLTTDMAHTAAALVGSLCAKLGVDIPGADIQKVINNGKVSDHHAIILTAEAVGKDPAELPEAERDILSLVTVRLLAAVGGRHTYEAVTAQITCEGHAFTARGKAVLSPGWKETEARAKAALGMAAAKEEEKEGEDGEEDKTLDVSEGQVFAPCPCAVREHWTSPPEHYTDGTILSAMESAGSSDYEPGSDTEKKGLGTPATRAAIIETLIARGYVTRDKKRLLVTDKGESLIKLVPETIKSAKTTAEWETQLQRMAKGQADAGDFMAKITAFTRTLVAFNSSPAQDITFTNRHGGDAAAKPIGKCPACGKGVTETPKAYACGGGRGECRFIVWKSMSGKTVTKALVKQLLENGKTEKIGGFKSKAGKGFEAALTVREDNTVGFEF